MSSDNQATACTNIDEPACAQPWHMDDMVPYCDVCGRYRQTIDQQEQHRRYVGEGGTKDCMIT